MQYLAEATNVHKELNPKAECHKSNGYRGQTPKALATSIPHVVKALRPGELEKAWPLIHHTLQRGIIDPPNFLCYYSRDQTDHSGGAFLGDFSCSS